MPTVPRRAQCRLTAFGEAVLTFPYSALLVADLKAHIPFRFRTYDGVTKTWTVSDAYATLAVDLLLEHYPDAETPRRSRAQPRSRAGSGGNDFEILHLLPTAPREVVDASFRALAKLHHPDKGGDPAVMRRLAEAHDALRRRVSA